MMNLNTPKGLRLHIGIFGRTNVGKSSFLNLIAGQDVAITSPMAGTTTDVVEKTMEFLPIGPVVFLDTAGLDDRSTIGELRLEKTKKVFDRAEVIVLVTEPGVWTRFEEDVFEEAERRAIPCIIVVNKVDLEHGSVCDVSRLVANRAPLVRVSCLDESAREQAVNRFKRALIEVCPEEFLNPAALVGDLVPAGGCVVLVVPIDLQAPKGRLILPQVQAIRDLLDNDAAVLVVKEREYRAALENLKTPPSLVVCDSQVVQKMVADTPPAIPCTTFSILFSRFKGDLNEMVRGVRTIDHLKNGSKVLIGEACSHHAAEDDIGRVKIPRWLRQYTGAELDFHVHAGCDYPENIQDFDLIVHCGSCTLNRRSMLNRIERAKEARVPMTNYGVCISYSQGVLERVLSPFPAALTIFKKGSKACVAGRN